ncbi:hypothetical protein KDAU_52660 [Dictyobacter aurantiacus]|uniref:Zinc-ribbon domain-containing protein n=1 Tax=Dictyobacter aurantiacus TaxID=1936993 RepID=A0A401ZM27_9CHLR|nr:hypothetical protein KDAU_52660 [Dictyobacter aurantiacus]
MAKYCLYCGLQFSDTTKFCPNCGRLIESGFRVRPLQKSEVGSFRRDLSEQVNVPIEKEINKREKVNL